MRQRMSRFATAMYSMSDTSIPNIDAVREAARRIAPAIHHTPVLRSRFFDAATGASVYFKCENFQRVGAFKFRGASNAVLSLSDDEARRGVVTHSSGNHAQALALAAQCARSRPRSSCPPLRLP